MACDSDSNFWKLFMESQSLIQFSKKKSIEYNLNDFFFRWSPHLPAFETRNNTPQKSIRSFNGSWKTSLHDLFLFIKNP